MSPHQPTPITPKLSRSAHGLLACPHCWLLALWSLAIIGIAAAIALAKHPDNFRRYNLSALGADDRAAPVFNGTLIATGIGFFILAILIYRLLGELARHGRLGTWRAASLAVPLGLVGLALVGAGIFQLNGHTEATLHTLASMSGLLSILFLMLTPLGALGALFAWASRGLAALITTLFALSSEHLMGVTLMEVSVLLLIGAWLFYLAVRLRVAAFTPSAT
jgi:hypothetical membrane protein